MSDNIRSINLNNIILEIQLIVFYSPNMYIIKLFLSFDSREMGIVKSTTISIFLRTLSLPFS